MKLFLAFAIDGTEFEIIAATTDFEQAKEAIRSNNGGYGDNDPVDLEQVGEDLWRGEGTGISLDFEIHAVYPSITDG